MNEPLHVVCPGCHAINRMPTGRLEQGPTCGKCREPLFNGHPMVLDREHFDRHIARNDIPMLVDFWAPWCGPCRSMAPQFERAAGHLEPRVRLAKVDTEAEPSLGERHAIRSIPTLVLFRRGREVARHSGAMAARDIIHWFEAQRG